MDKVKVRVKWARTVTCETVIEVPDDPSLFEGGKYVGNGEYDLPLPTLFDGKIPKHVVDVCDESNIWEVENVKE